MLYFILICFVLSPQFRPADISYAASGNELGVLGSIHLRARTDLSINGLCLRHCTNEQDLADAIMSWSFPGKKSMALHNVY